MTSDYDSIKAINCSGLKAYHESKAQYYYRYVAKTWDGEQSDAFRLGSLLHTMVLEPEKLEADWACEDPPLGKSKDAGPVKSGKAYDAWASVTMLYRGCRRCENIDRLLRCLIIKIDRLKRLCLHLMKTLACSSKGDAI
jgi:hypothetical protein